MAYGVYVQLELENVDLADLNGEHVIKLDEFATLSTEGMARLVLRGQVVGSTKEVYIAESK